MFSAKAPQNGKWTIWRKSLVTHKYKRVFNDQYNRCHIKVSPDKKEMVYVRYKTQKEGAMHAATLDSAWVCLGATNGDHEAVLFLVPQFNKNAIYDLDWSGDKQRIIFASGNDEYPTLTRDGDIFEYDIATGKITNKTNNWDLWSKFCKYSPGGQEFAYSHYAHFWYAWPTDIFVQHADGSNQQLTNSTFHQDNWGYCTVTEMGNDELIYRRGTLEENKLYKKDNNGEQLLFSGPGYGGKTLAPDLYAATDSGNNILLFTSKATVGSLRISGIENFKADDTYNYGTGPVADLNWLGKQNTQILWSTGERTPSIIAQPDKNTTYYCTITENGIEYRDSINVKVTGKKPVIVKKCMTLTTARGLAHQWFVNGNPIPGASDSAYTPEAGGAYAVTVTDRQGRTVTSLETMVTIAEADSMNKLNDNVKIIPDPSSYMVRIEAPVAVNLAITDENGKMVLQKVDAHEIDMNPLPDGVYSIMLYDDNCLKLKSRKIKKEK